MERTFDINHRNACERSLTLEQKHWFDPLEAARIQTIAHTLGLQEKLKTLLFVQG